MASEPLATCSRVELDAGTWALRLRLSCEHPARLQRSPTRIHIVLDNSASMRGNTRSAQEWGNGSSLWGGEVFRGRKVNNYHGIMGKMSSSENGYRSASPSWSPWPRSLAP